MAAAGPRALGWANQLFTPLVDSLRFIGLGVAKPFLDGPMPPHFYRNMTGLGVWSAVVYDVASFLELFVNKQSVVMAAETAHQRMMKKTDWGPVRAWFALQAVLIFYGIPVRCFA